MTLVEGLVVAGALVALGLVVARIFAFKAWAEAKAAGVDIGLVELFGMRVRSTDPAEIVAAAVLAKYGQVPFDLRSLEAHALAGGRPRRVVAGQIEGEKRGLEIDFHDLAAVDLDGRDPVDHVRGRLV